MKKNLICLALLCCSVFMLAGCGNVDSKQLTEQLADQSEEQSTENVADQSEEQPTESVADQLEKLSTEQLTEQSAEQLTEQAGTVISAIAQDENDLTGTYEDTDMSLKLIIIQRDGLVTYNFCCSDGSDPFIETDCIIESTYISGQYFYITKKMNGALAISSGVGEAWGNFVKIDDEAIIDLADMDFTMSDVTSTLDFTFYLDTDVEKGLLYANAEGKITDASGNVIPEYDYLFASPAGSLIDTSDNCILEGYEVSENGQISRYMVISDNGYKSENSSITEMIELRCGQYRNPKSPVIITIPDELYSDGYSDIFVYVPIYIGTEDNEYAYECSGLVNLLNLGTITIYTGLQNTSSISYSYEEGSLFSEINKVIRYALGDDYVIDEVTKFYLDEFIPNTVYFSGSEGTYLCDDNDGYKGQIYVADVTEEKLEFDISSLRSDNVYFVYGGYATIVDTNTAVYYDGITTITLVWDNDGNLNIHVEGIEYSSNEEANAISAVIGQTFKYESTEYLGW